MKTNKALLIIVMVLVAILAAVLAASGMYLRGEYERDTFFADTVINGYDASDLTPSEVMEKIIGDYSSPQITLYEDSEAALRGTLAEFGYTIDEDHLLSSLENKLDSQKSSLTQLIGSLMNGSSFQVTVPFRYSQDTFLGKVNAANLSTARTANENASLEYNEAENYYYIKPEVQGNMFSDEQLQTSVKEQIDSFVSGNNPNTNLELQFPEDIYIQPDITSADADLNNRMNVYNSFCKAVITYEFGSQTETIDWSTIQDWVFIEDGTGMLSREKIWAHVTDLASRYNTRHYDRTFQTSLGTEVIIPSAYNEYGYLVNEEGEVSQLVADIQSNSEVSREPVYYSTNSDYGNPLYYQREGTDDLAGTYVEVNLTKQHLWFYKDGVLVIESDFVSGSVAKQAETQTGAFPLAYKESPSVLVGEDAKDGYRTEVQYWMPFYEGQGLHDATWRTSFGSSIYQTNGSHGCVNLPPAAAKTIYENIDAGVAIIIYK